MQQPDLVVIGGADTDYTMHGECLPDKDRSVNADALLCTPGGKGVNQAIAAARLGARVAFIGMVGDDARGNRILARLDDEGVDICHVERHPDAPTGATMIMVGKDGETRRMAAPGANRLLQPSHIRYAADTIRHAGFVLAQLEVPIGCIECAFGLAYGRDIRTMLDAAPAVPLSDELLRITTVVRGNAHEAQCITGIAVTDEHSAVHAARQLIARGARIALMETGHGSNIVVDAQAVHTFSYIPVVAADNTGAGDAFSAAFAVSLIDGENMRDAGFAANAAAAFGTTRVTAFAALPTSDELAHFMRSHTQPAC